MRAGKRSNASSFLFFLSLFKVQVPCKGEDLFGVQICAEGWVPDLPTLRLQQVPVFPAVALTKLRVSMAPAADKPTAVHCRGQVTQKSEKGN